MKHYLETSEHSVELFKSAINLIYKHAIHPTPINYLICYEYCNNKNRDADDWYFKFQRDFDRIIEKSDGFHDVSGLKLYIKYFKDAPENPYDIIHKTQDLPEIIKTTSSLLRQHIKYHIALLEQPHNIVFSNESLTELNKKVRDVSVAANDIKNKYKAIKLMIEQDVSHKTRDYVTGLYNEKAVVSYYEELKEIEDNGKNVYYLLFVKIKGIDKLRKLYGSTIEPAVARHFVSCVSSLIKEPQSLYRWSMDDAYLVFSQDAEQLQQLVFDMKNKFESKPLFHKLTNENVIDQTNLHYAILETTGKSLVLALRLAHKNLHV